MEKYYNTTEILQHEIAWYYNGGEHITELADSEIEFITEKIIEGYYGGDLNYYEYDEETQYEGWWDIL